MVFPQTELPLFVDIAPGGSPMGTTESWDPYWVDITRDVRVSNKVVIEEGIPDEANQADPGSCVLTLDNGISRVPATAGQVGCYSPRNPLGPYYGALTKNTPLRVRILRGRETFNRTTGPGWGTSDSGSTYTTQNSLYSTDGTGRGIVNLNPNATTSTTMTGAGAWDFEMTGAVSVNAIPTNVASADAYHIVNFRRAANANQYTMLIDWNPAGNMSFFISRTINSVTTQLAGVTTPTIGAVSANTQYRFRLKAEGGFISAKIWLASGAEPLAYNINVVDPGYTLDNTALGTNIQFQSTRLSGNVTTTAHYWHDFRISTYPFIGNVPEWPVRWDQSGNDSTAPIKATGVLRRLQAGKNPVKSPLYSFIDGLKPVGLWTLEDPSGASLASAQTTNTKGATLFSTSPSGWDGPPKLGGTSGQYTVAVDTTISGTLPRVVPNGSWLAWFTYYMPVLPVTNPLIFRVRSSGTIVQWDLHVSDDFGGVLYLQGTTADGTMLVNQSVTYTPGQWTIGQIEIQQLTSTTFTARLVKYQITDGGVSGTTSATQTGNIGAPNAWSIYGSTGFQASAAGPVAFFPFIPSVNIANLQASARGFVGEDAATRIARLAAERGLRVDLVTGGRSSLMGVQSSDTFLAVTAEAATTDIGLLTEFRGGLRYRSRGRRYGQFSRMQLDFAAGHIKEPPEPVDDDQRLRNDITVSRKDGSSARALDAASIAANGLYDTSVDVNPASDDDLPGQAGFRLYLGTWDEMRWPSVTLDLARNAGVTNYIERATALDPGAYTIVSNPPANLPVGPLRLLVEAVKTTMGPFEWTVELTCQPYGPWRITDSAASNGQIPRMDLVGSTLGSAEAASTIGATDTWTITNSGRNWDATEVPFDWDANGERVTVTALSGTGTQTATVTRGVGGITKAHTVGESITLADPLYVAL